MYRRKTIVIEVHRLFKIFTLKVSGRSFEMEEMGLLNVAKGYDSLADVMEFDVEAVDVVDVVNCWLC
ncbi:hypothetical protein Tco_0359700 [Tanacetum coccineum]